MRLRVLRYDKEWWCTIVAKENPMQYEYGKERDPKDEWNNPMPQDSELALMKHLREHYFHAL